MISEQEELALQQFRKMTSEYLDNRKLMDDDFLLRWLRARNLDLKKAEEMLKNCLEWRSSTEVKKLLDWTPPEMVEKDFVYKFVGHDSEGRPVMVVPFGRWNVRKMIEAGLKEEAFKAVYKLLEVMKKELKMSGKTQFVAILDSAELTFGKVAHYETIETVVTFFKNFESYYPETLHSCYIINAAWVFPYIFNFVKPLLSARTLGKVQIFCHEKQWKPVLHENLPTKVLLQSYGGVNADFF